MKRMKLVEILIIIVIIISTTGCHTNSVEKDDEEPSLNLDATIKQNDHVNDSDDLAMEDENSKIVAGDILSDDQSNEPILEEVVESKADIFKSELEALISAYELDSETSEKVLSDGVLFYDIATGTSDREDPTYYFGVGQKEGYGYLLNNLAIEDLHEIQDNHIYLIEDIGFDNWVKVRMIEEQPIETWEDIPRPPTFIAKKNNFHKWLTMDAMETLPLDETKFYELLNDYKYMIIDNEEASYNSYLERDVHDVNLYELPSLESTIIGFALEGDRVKVHEHHYFTDDSGIKWQMVEMIPHYWTNSRIGWVTEDQIKVIDEEDDPLQKLAFKGCLVYKEPKEGSELIEAYNIEDYVKPLINGELFLVRAIKYDDEWSFVTDGINGLFAGYVRSDELVGYLDESYRGHFVFTDETIEKVLDVIKEQISNSEELIIYSDDLGTSVTLSESERLELANQLTTVYKRFRSDQSGTSIYYCDFPRIRLSFTEGDLYLNDRGSMIVRMSTEGKSGFGMPEDFYSYVFMNESFGDALYRLFPVYTNIETSNLAYLLGSKTLYMTGDYSFDHRKDATENEKKNSVLRVWRVLDNHLGDKMKQPEVIYDVKDMINIHFVFDDDSEKVLQVCNEYVHYQGNYYRIENGENFLGGIFAGGGF